MVVESEIRLEENGPQRGSAPSWRAPYRLVQETLTNTMKHANAERVELTLKAIGGEVRLSVSDDGSGFLLDQSAGGFGLIGMRERVELVGGRLEVESSPGGGTVVRARLPVRPPRAALLSTRRKGRRASDLQVF